jgi:hypothetical protein
MSDDDETSGEREAACVGVTPVGGRTSGARAYTRHDDAWRPTGDDYDVSWRMSARSEAR